jgi:putative membrane protein insertion efficiency factor
MLIRLIRLYQVSTAKFPPVCRYTPSCSEYAIRAIEKHGSLKGSMLALWRICRCNPFAHGGHDPVP